ncbi:MAG: hypothetical protein COA52_02305 [Hyphomicrobiales bacterium]|nr:MAG: hypothetical protein COA52_02305 [Hyphomicrobiales bacterium]
MKSNQLFSRPLSRLAMLCLAGISLLAFEPQTADAARRVETQNFLVTPEDADAPQSEAASDGSGSIPADEAMQTTTRISHDVTLLPLAVQSLRQSMIDAARSGNLNALRPFMAVDDSAPQLGFGGEEGDKIEILRGMSGDTDGQEVLAILLEVLESGYAHVDPDTDAEIFVWPYFAHTNIEKLTPAQRVELFTLVTAGDYEDMLDFGAYHFFRLGISKGGRWEYFVAGD